MSIFSTIASDLGSVFSDPGKLVTDVVDALLPDKLRSIGDLAGGVADGLLGKESQALTHFQDGLRDLPELLGDPTPPAAALQTAADGTETSNAGPATAGDLGPTNQTLPSLIVALQERQTSLAQSLRV